MTTSFQSVEGADEKKKGILVLQVGNALTDDFHDHLGVFQFMWSSGLISDETYKLLNVFCDFQSFIHTSPQCDKILDIASEELGNIDPYSIFTPSCTGNGTLSNRLLKRLHVSIGIYCSRLIVLHSLFYPALGTFSSRLQKRLQVLAPIVVSSY